MKRLIVLMTVILSCKIAFPVFSQALQRLSFEFTMDPMDLAPKNYPQTDSNGDLYAIVKVRPKADALRFSFGMMKCIVDQNRHNDETWLYVQKSARRISISGEGYQPIVNQDLGQTVEAGVTYILQLKMSNPETFQFVDFVVDAPDATIRINGKTLIVKDGKVSTKLPLGKYDFEVSAPMYQSVTGKVNVNDALSRVEETVHLIPSFKEVTLIASEGVEIWVDDEYKGTSSWTGNLEFSTYNVECRLAGYCLAAQNITIEPEGQSEYTFSLPHAVTSQTAKKQSQVKEDVAVVSVVAPTEVDEPQANMRIVKGAVINKWGSPLEGASVGTKDGYASTVTGKDGSFSLGVPVWSKTLVAKYRYKVGKQMRVEDDMVFKLREGYWFATALAGCVIHGDEIGSQLSIGLRTGYLGNWGGYVKFNYSFHDDMYIGGGVAKRIGLPFYMYVGAGWSVVEFMVTGGGNYRYSQSDSHLAVECGAIFKIANNLTFSAGVSYASVFTPEIGIGYAF